MQTFITAPVFNSIFKYKKENYYDLVAFNKTDSDLYEYSLNSEMKYFNK